MEDETSSGEYQARDDKAEQETTSEHYEQEAKQLLKLHRPDKLLTATLFFEVMGGYLLYLTTLIAFGVLAYYSGHFTILEVAFVVCGLLIIAVPVGVIWYLLANYSKKPSETDVSTEKTSMGKFARSPLGRFLLRFGRLATNRFVRLFQYAIFIFTIVDSIGTWPDRPRLSLAAIALGLSGLFINGLGDTSRWVLNAVAKDVKELWNFNAATASFCKASVEVAKSIGKTLDERHESNQKAHEDIAFVLKGLRDVYLNISSMANPPKPVQLDPAPDEPPSQPEVKDKEGPTDR
jgi:hypothetical protein